MIDNALKILMTLIILSIRFLHLEQTVYTQYKDMRLMLNFRLSLHFLLLISSYN